MVFSPTNYLSAPFCIIVEVPCILFYVAQNNYGANITICWEDCRDSCLILLTSRGVFALQFLLLVFLLHRLRLFSALHIYSGDVGSVMS